MTAIVGIGDDGGWDSASGAHHVVGVVLRPCCEHFKSSRIMLFATSFHAGELSRRVSLDQKIQRLRGEAIA